MQPIPNPLRIIILDENKFSRNWIALLLMRDWRTQVIAEYNSIEAYQGNTGPSLAHAHAIVINCDTCDPNCITQENRFKPSGLRIIALSTHPDNPALEFFIDDHITSYLLIDEIDNSLAWAVASTMGGNKIITPGIEQHLLRRYPQFNTDCLVFSGIEATFHLTPTEARNARMAFIMSMSRGNLADELQIGVNSSFTLISRLYDHLGINDLLEGDDWIDLRAEEDPLLQEHLQKMKERTPPPKRKAAKETLAFHVVTKPCVHVFGR
jgi:DNA-binding NarL/FixJ family response regulator